MKYPQYIAVLVFCFLLMASGCGGDDASRTLDRAEASKDNHADSALAIIDSLHIDDIRDEAVRARYALLKTYVKANLQQLAAGDSSLIDIAVGYYEDKGMADEAAMASFYKADITYSAGDYAGAMRHALKSLEWNENACNQRFRAKTYDLISDIYSSVFNYPQGVAYGRRAASVFSVLGLKKNELFSLMGVANAYAHDDFMEDKAVELLDSLQENFRDADSTALGMLHYRYRYPLNLSGRHQDAYNHYRKALSYWKGEDLFDNKPFVAKMFTNIGMYDSAAYYLGQERMINPDYDNDLNYHSALCALADSLGDVALYNKEVRRVSELERENVRFAMRDEVSLIERDFEHDRAEREHLKKERNKLVFIFAGIFTVVVGLLLIVIMRQKHRLKVMELQKKEAATRQQNEVLQKKEAATRQENEQLQQKEAETRQQNEELLQKEAATRQENEKLHEREAETMKAMDELQTRLQGVMLESEAIKKLNANAKDISVVQPLLALDALYNEFFTMMDMGKSVGERRYLQIIDRFNKEIEKMRAPSYIRRLQKHLDPRNDGIFTHLRGRRKQPNEEDMKMLTYLVAGFSMRTVCLFCGLKEDNNYARKKRLMDRLKQTDPEGYDILQLILRRSPAERLASL